MRKSIVISLCFFLLIFSCKKDEVPPNPYDSINRDTSGNTTTPPDPNSIVGLHQNIFFPKCANPGCHDGTFEPDFRTVASSYSTLIYQPVNKVTLDSINFFFHRVIPNNTTSSFLIERLTTSTDDYMPSNSVRLSQSEIDHVRTWINNGCPDANGNLPSRPDLLPNIVGYIALDALNNRIDTSRLNNFPANPFLVDSGATISIPFLALDTADGANAVNPANFTVKQIKLSTDKNDFSAATTINAFYLQLVNAFIPTVPITGYPRGTTVYFRFYVNDGNHPINSEFPRTSSVEYYKTYYAFYVR